jgi:hypothetical protein
MEQHSFFTAQRDATAGKSAGGEDDSAGPSI